MEFDIELITRRYIWRQIGIFAKICVRFKDAARERLVLIINESKLKQGKSLRIRGVIAHRGVEYYDIRVLGIRLHIGRFDVQRLWMPWQRNTALQQLAVLFQIRLGCGNEGSQLSPIEINGLSR